MEGLLIVFLGLSLLLCLVFACTGVRSLLEERNQLAEQLKAYRGTDPYVWKDVNDIPYKYYITDYKPVFYETEKDLKERGWI